jgi:hypothetical protein
MKLLESIVLACGVALAGWFVGDAIITFRAMDQVVEVRGLDERIVSANEGSLDLRYVVSAPSIKELSSQLETTQVMNSSNEVIASGRYSARSGAQVFSNDVAKIQALAQETDQLIAKGVALESTLPRFSFTDLNSLKPKMLVAATQSAREAAQSFARDSGAQLGGIKSATQGLFSITAPGVDYDDQGSIQKRVRVVTRVSYYME